jgi:hypothetical protein
MRSNDVGKQGCKEKTSSTICASLSEVGKEPEEQRKSHAEDEAGDDREIESGVFAAVHDVAGEAAKMERELVSEID